MMYLFQEVSLYIFLAFGLGFLTGWMSTSYKNLKR